MRRQSEGEGGTLAKIVAVLLALWIGWLVYQYFDKSSTAFILVKQKLAEFNSMDLNTLSEKLGKGVEYAEHESAGRKYLLRWSVSKLEKAEAGAPRGAIEIRGRVDFIDLLPFGLFGLRAGSPFRLLIYLTG